MDDRDAVEYRILNERLIHMEVLKHQIITSYVAIATPMAAVLFLTSFSTFARMTIAIIGCALSLVWITMAIRQNAYGRRYVTRMLELESDQPGYMVREIEWMRSHLFLSHLPGLSKMLVSLFAFGIFYFFVAFLVTIFGWQGLNTIVQNFYERLHELWHDARQIIIRVAH